MALATATISFDLADILGVDFDARRTKVWVDTNVPNDTIVDTIGNQIRLGSGSVTIAADGTGSVVVWVPGAGSNPASWQTTVHVDYPDSHAHGGRTRRDFGPFTITASANLADLVDEQEVPPAYLSALTAELDEYATDAANSAAVAQSAADLAQSIGGIDSADDAITLLDATPSSDFRVAQDARLSATFATHETYVSVKRYGATGNGSTNDTAAIQAAITAVSAAGGGTVFFPRGTYLVTAPFADITTSAVNLKGAGRDASLIKLGANLASALLHFKGATSLTNQQKWSSVTDMAFWNPARTYSGDMVKATSVSDLRLSNVAFNAIKGRVLHGIEWWDSVIEGVTINSCGDATATAPVIDLEAVNPADVETGCNNLSFIATRIEGSYYYALHGKTHTRKIRWIGGKIHGLLPTPASYATVLLDSASYCQFIGTNFAKGGASHIVIQAAAKGNVISSCSIDAAIGYGVDIVSGSDTVIVGNEFGSQSVNTVGSVRATAGTGNVVESNVSKDATYLTAAASTVLATRASVGLTVDGGVTALSRQDSNTVLTVSRLSTTPANADATDISLSMKTSTNALKSFATLKAIATDVTNASEDSDFTIRLREAGADVERLRVKNNGEVQVFGPLNHDGASVGFYGNAPVARAAVSGSRGGNAALASLLTALANLGLITDGTSA